MVTVSFWPFLMACVCRSGYAFKAALGVLPASHYEHHMCSNPQCSRVFTHLPRKQWVAHKDEVCAWCGYRRFKGDQGAPEPQKRMWYFGVEQSLQRLLSDPVVREHIKNGTARKRAEGSSMYSSDAFKQLDSDCAGALTKDGVTSLLLSLGGDGVQLLNWGSRTATVIGLKCEDLPSELVQKGIAVLPLVVIEGKQEPAVLSHGLAAVAEFFLKHAPSSNRKGAVRSHAHIRGFC